MNRKIILVGVVLGHILVAFAVLPLLGKSDFFPFYRYNHLAPPGLHSVSSSVSIDGISLSAKKTDSFWDIPALLENVIRLVHVDRSTLSINLDRLDVFFQRDSVVQGVEMTFEVRQLLSEGVKTLTYKIQAQAGKKSEWELIEEEWSK